MSCLHRQGPRGSFVGARAGPGLRDLCILRTGWLCSGAVCDRPPLHLCLSLEVGVCSFARFSGDLLSSRPSASDPAPVEVATDGPETPVQDSGQTVCFSALGMVQCCKVGREARVWGCCTGGRRRGSKRMEGLGALVSSKNMPRMCAQTEGLSVPSSPHKGQALERHRHQGPEPPAPLPELTQLERAGLGFEPGSVCCPSSRAGRPLGAAARETSVCAWRRRERGPRAHGPLPGHQGPCRGCPRRRGLGRWSGAWRRGQWCRVVSLRSRATSSATSWAWGTVAGCAASCRGRSAWTRPCGGPWTSVPSACGSCSTCWASSLSRGTR